MQINESIFKFYLNNYYKITSYQYKKKIKINEFKIFISIQMHYSLLFALVYKLLNHL